MTLTRLTRVLGAATLTAGFLLAGLPTASADQVRDGQWANQYFNLDKVWSVTKGDGIKVAVIDEGVDPTFPDLVGQVLPGYDPSGGDHERKPTDPHGTGMASLIAGRGHGSNEGVLGLAPGAKIIPVYKDSAAGGDAVPEGIKWAVDHGAGVINISLSGADNPKMADAVSYAVSHNVVVVAGAGNDGGPVESPANTPGVIAVGAVNKDLKSWDKSNSGPEIMLSAPGVDIVHAGPCSSSQYCMADGTSDATAYVSATAALVRAKFPNLTAGQVANRLVKSAKAPAGAGKLPDTHYGYGIVRAYEALTMDIPAGSAQGPLAGAATGSSPSAGATAGTGAGSADPGSGLGDPDPLPAIKGSSSGSSLPLILGIAAVVVVLFIVIIAIAVASSRKRNRAQAVPGQPGGPAPYGAQQGWPPAQPQQQPYGQQPPMPPYGQQAPPPGYPPQQTPYQNPYQDGNQSR
ncbi:S8 family serine peptidase [Kitasatospora sp. NPDC049285]|uniref:S8 family serine peptidase n=1 Tax=Kitasatospora sp. NPDC049285 TaxID=3157096 RepID=UPI00343C6EBA